MAQLTLNLLGPFTVTLDEQPLKRFRSRKIQALLAYLVTEEAFQPGVTQSREGLMTLLWPDIRLQSKHTRGSSSSWTICVSQLMIALTKLGRQAEAWRLYNSCCERLRAELGVEPGHELQQLVEKLQVGRLNSTPAEQTRPIPTESASKLPAYLASTAPEEIGGGRSLWREKRCWPGWMGSCR